MDVNWELRMHGFGGLLAVVGSIAAVVAAIASLYGVVVERRRAFEERSPKLVLTEGPRVSTFHPVILNLGHHRTNVLVWHYLPAAMLHPRGVVSPP